MTIKWIHIDPFNIDDWFGFVYKIKNKANGKIYIGKKVFWNNTKKRLTKKELAELTGPGKKPTFKVVTKESNWMSYWGSSKALLEDLKEFGPDNFERKILKLCKTKKELTYFELHYQCAEGVLLQDSYNDNILGKFYRRDITNQ